MSTDPTNACRESCCRPATAALGDRMVDQARREVFAARVIEAAADHDHPDCLLCQALAASSERITNDGRALYREAADAD